MNVVWALALAAAAVGGWWSLTNIIAPAVVRWFRR
jgi:hypothetical protein